MSVKALNKTFASVWERQMHDAWRLTWTAVAWVEDSSKTRTLLPKTEVTQHEKWTVLGSWGLDAGSWKELEHLRYLVPIHDGKSIVGFIALASDSGVTPGESQREGGLLVDYIGENYLQINTPLSKLYGIEIAGTSTIQTTDRKSVV